MRLEAQSLQRAKLTLEGIFRSNTKKERNISFSP